MDKQALLHKLIGERRHAWAMRNHVYYLDGPDEDRYYWERMVREIQERIEELIEE